MVTVRWTTNHVSGFSGWLVQSTDSLVFWRFRDYGEAMDAAERIAEGREIKVFD